MEIAFGTLREIRQHAQACGLKVDGLGRNELMAAISAKKAEVEGLRLECVKLGLSAEGHEAELRVRLTAYDPHALTAGDRKLYRVTGWAMVGLGAAALTVSLPHLGSELGRITGLHWCFAAALAVLVDGGIVGSKLLDVLRGKFALGKLAAVNTVAMAACLVLSAAVNASGFVRHGETGVPLAVLFAAFLSGFVWLSFYAGAFLLTRMERAGEPQAATPDRVAKLRTAAAELARLQTLADKV